MTSRVILVDEYSILMLVYAFDVYPILEVSLQFDFVHKIVEKKTNCTIKIIFVTFYIPEHR